LYIECDYTICIPGKLCSAEDFSRDLEENADWVTVKYKFNRGVLYDGSLPHLATPITYIRGDAMFASSSVPRPVDRKPEAPSMADLKYAGGEIDSDKPVPMQSVGTSSTSFDGHSELGPNPKRVILGLNCFPQEVDECCRRAPEHSGKEIQFVHRVMKLQ
jgi:hypothetical protein